MPYDKTSALAVDFINHDEIEKTLAYAKVAAKDYDTVRTIINKAKTYGGLNHTEAAVLTYVDDPMLVEEMYATARDIKEHIYGKRIVMFAPIYISDYCINECTYCGYHRSNKMQRNKLTMEELVLEVEALESMGHKRLALEAGEDPKNCPIEYVLSCIDTIYKVKNQNGEIRRVNINIAATTVENYQKLKEAGIGTYILFQETYNKEMYEKLHLSGPKSNYEYHTTAHDRAMEGGIDDVGIGVLYGLYDWHYEIVGTFLHAEHLEAVYGVGPHTISVPRIRPACGIAMNQYPYPVTDEDFKRIIAVIRLSVPYTGIIISTREDAGFREECIALGVSQTSAGSATGVGGYSNKNSAPQFEVADHRTPLEITKMLLKKGYIPSFCTACYRQGRTGDRFMRLAKTGQIANVCQANALITLKEYACDYGDEEFITLANEVIGREVENIPNEAAKLKTKEYLNKIELGERDFRF